MPLAPPPIEPHAPQPLHGRVVLVTGGAQGIGRAIAQGVLAAGGRVAIGDLDAEAGAACLREWDVGARALFVRMDVAREASVRSFVRRALAAFGRIDGLVNNAGLAQAHAGDITTLTLSDWRRWIDSHLTGAFLCCRHALPALREARGAIVNIASTRALQSEPDTAPYSAAKGGLVALTHALAISEGPRVRANAISPGSPPTPGTSPPIAAARSWAGATMRSIRSAASANRRTSRGWRCSCCRRRRASSPGRTSSPTVA